MNPARLAELLREHAARTADVARLELQMADELDDKAPPATAARRTPRQRPPFRPEPRDVSPVARAAANRALRRIEPR